MEERLAEKGWAGRGGRGKELNPGKSEKNAGEPSTCAGCHPQAKPPNQWGRRDACPGRGLKTAGGGGGGASKSGAWTAGRIGKKKKKTYLSMRASPAVADGGTGFATKTSDLRERRLQNGHAASSKEEKKRIVRNGTPRMLGVFSERERGREDSGR